MTTDKTVCEWYTASWHLKFFFFKCSWKIATLWSLWLQKENKKFSLYIPYCFFFLSITVDTTEYLGHEKLQSLGRWLIHSQPLIIAVSFMLVTLSTSCSWSNI